MQQGCVVPFRIVDGRLEFCLITTIRSGSWSLPKGFVDAGETPVEAAAREAWEEAGVRGDVDDDSLGSFINTRWGEPAKVVAYLMQVRRTHESWPEQDQRQRLWCPAEEACERVAKSDHKKLLRQAIKRLNDSA